MAVGRDGVAFRAVEANAQPERALTVGCESDDRHVGGEGGEGLAGVGGLAAAEGDCRHGVVQAELAAVTCGGGAFAAVVDVAEGQAAEQLIASEGLVCRIPAVGADAAADECLVHQRLSFSGAAL